MHIPFDLSLAKLRFLIQFFCLCSESQNKKVAFDWFAWPCFYTPLPSFEGWSESSANNAPQ